jgi:localization factor PodJL
MKFGVPWSVKGIRPQARETAKEAARRSGVSLGEWLNSVIIQQAEQEGVHPDADDDDFNGDELAGVNERLDDLSRRIEQLMRTGPAAYAPRRARNESAQVADLIGRLDHRLDQFANVARPMLPPVMPPPMPVMQLPPSLDRAVAEIAARQRALKGEAPLAAPQAPPLVPAPAPLPVQNLSGLEEQLRNITDQIETLRKPGVEQAINALRDELAEIGHSLNEAMPRRAIDTIEKQIQGLNQRIAEGRQAGVDGGQLSGIEHGLAEVRDALRALTPAENLVGFNEAVGGLAHKIDLIVAQKDPETLAQLENAITTLRGMTGTIASNETVNSLATQVQALGDKVEQIARSGAGGDALGHLEQRIGALSDALALRAQNGAAVPPRLEALVESLSDKIEQIQSSSSRGDNVAFGHLEDRIVSLVEKLDASDSRLGHLEAIERGLAELLVNIEDIKAGKDAGSLRAGGAGGVDDLKQDIARTQDALEAVHGTLGIVVDRLATIEKDIRGEGRTRSQSEAEFDAPAPPVGKLAVRIVSEPAPQPQHLPPAAPLQTTPPQRVPTAPQQAAPPAPPPAQRLPAAKHSPIDPDLPPDQPLEPGSGPPKFRANPAARIAASEAALGGAMPVAAAAPGGKSGFIAAARRAAQAAGQEPAAPMPHVEPFSDEEEGNGLRAKLMKRIKSLFIAASVIAAVIGSIQIGGQWLKPDRHIEAKKTPVADIAKAEKPAPAAERPDVKPTAPLSLAADLPEAPKPPSGGAPPLNPPASGIAAEVMPSPDLGQTAQEAPPLFDPPLLETKSDVTGSIARSTIPAPAAQPQSDQLPPEIGGVHLRSAAIAGDAAAAYEVGARFAEGRGVPANLEEAAHWFELAAGKGLAPAQFRFASLLEKGQGVKKDLPRARRLYLAAAARGSAKAMHNLAVLYAEGIDGKPDYASAAQWFRKAADAGISDSQYNLGVLAARGLGIQTDMAESYKWFALAAAQGDKEAAKKRDEVAAHLDADALAAAKQAVASFKPKRPPDDAVNVPVPSGGWDHTSEAAPPKAKPHPPAQPHPGAPMSLGSFTVGKR